MNKEFIKGQLKGALSWLNTSNTNKNVLHAKDSINMALKELDDLKIYKKDINKLMPILKAFAEGRTIQFAVNGDSWIDIDGNEEGLFLDTLMTTPRRYRIKPEQKYRPFKDSEECWNEMLLHQPFGWVKSTLFKDFALVKRVTTLYVEINRDIIDYKDALEKFTFADDNNFGVKMDE